MAGAQAGAGSETPSRWRRARIAFRGWRRTRPFWGGLLVVLGAGEILFTYHAPLKLVLHFGLYGLAGFLLPALLVVLGLLLLFDPAHRTFYSILSVLGALGTWLTSNLGGFLLGMLLALVGGALAFGWALDDGTQRTNPKTKAKPSPPTPMPDRVEGAIE